MSSSLTSTHSLAEAPSRVAPTALMNNLDLVSTLDEVATLVKVLRRCGAGHSQALELAQRLIEHFGGIGRVIGAAPADLAREVGEGLAFELGEYHALLVRVLEHPLRDRPVISSTLAAKAYVAARLRALPREAFHVLFLDKRNQLITDERMNEGTVDHVPVYPREVVRRALELSASAVLLVHNHPSGDPNPSSADITMTRQVVSACRVLNIAVHDHLIVAGDDVASLKGLGLM
jgi:DNA repair protein RadC